MPVLQVDKVYKRYGATTALAGATFAVEEGELFGLLGPNGAGKTTLMSILAGLADADAGDVQLFGESFQSNNRDLRSRVGLATQDLAIYPELSARENLRFFGKLYGLRGSDLTQRVTEMLASVELQSRANDRAGTFSGGMKRRLNLAIALVHRPRILLLDEPTTGVDPQSRNHIFERIKDYRDAGHTVIYTSHYMEEVQTLCPRIAILDAGTVRACDTRENLLARLDTQARIKLHNVSADLATRVQAIPGVLTATLDGDTLRVTAKNLPPMLASILAACGDIDALEIDQPNLERVFLTLTGHKLRD